MEPDPAMFESCWNPSQMILATEGSHLICRGGNPRWSIGRRTYQEIRCSETSDEVCRLLGDKERILLRGFPVALKD